MQELVNRIIIKTGIQETLVLKKPIRGLPGITFKQLVHSLLKNETIEDTAICLGYTANPVKQAIRASLGNIFPERAQKFGVGGGVASWRYTLLHYIEHKHCWHCSKVLPHSEFTSDTANSDLLNSECKLCHTYRSKEQKYFISQRTPSWANQEEIKLIYSMCPKGYAVDHIIPLRGRLVSGLHVASNLQYLTAEENMQKGNRFEV